VARNNQRFLLATVGADPRPEIDRLVSLGATLLAVDEGGSAELIDPDGKEFCLRPAGSGRARS
jgi:hypothetical protein